MKHFVFLFAALTLAAGNLLASPGERVHREFARTKERDLTVIVDVAFGSLVIEHGTSGRIAVVEYDEASDDSHKVQVSYDVSGTHGTLHLKMKKSSHIWGDDEEDDRSNDKRIVVSLAGDLPIDFEVELGAGKGDLDFSGLQVQGLRISTGASSVTMRCDQPNPIEAGEVRIESGVSKFTATNLSNVNFRRMRFSGGIGAYKLDFGGTLRHSGDVKVEVGLGSVTVNVPRTIQAQLLYDDGLFSSFDLDDDFAKKHGGIYETDGFGDAAKSLTIKLESGLGSVRVRRH
jgi:hypothetical protein